MPALDSKLRSQLDTVCQQAREKAEEAARSALVKRAVDAAEPHAHFKAAEKVLRNRLRARGRQAGDVRNPNKTQSIEQLSQELAYEYWHRMLFARFLAENHLLMHPDGVAVSLEECEELAAADTSPTRERGALNGFTLAARYASKMLPQVFRTDDVLLEIEFAPEHRLALEKLLASLPRETFLADDSLGWVYQFWQTSRKKAVNESGNKIDSRTISSVTQLFTEDYMVQFLLHNTLGAWWYAKEGISGQGAAVSPDKCPVALEYLRWRDDGTPAAGKFEGWPKSLKEFTLLDPCCGSGHFLVAAFNLLVPLRMHDEGLSAREACDAVLRENLFGLELDPRCTQIAAFALAVAAWKFPNVAGALRDPASGHGVPGPQGEPLGYRPLPPLNIACTGIGPQATEEEWLTLAEQSGRRMNVLSREPIMNGLRNLHALFSNAPTLGSLIDPSQLSADLITADYETLKPYLCAALTAEQADDDVHERAVAAAGMVKAAELLSGSGFQPLDGSGKRQDAASTGYTLVITNVPYLGRGKQDDTLKQHLEQHFPNSKADLATAFVERCLEFCAKDGTTALVTPQNWLFLTSYARLRERILRNHTWNSLVLLGEEAWWSFGIRGPRTVLQIVSETRPDKESQFFGIDVSTNRGDAVILLNEKVARLADTIPTSVLLMRQIDQLQNPDGRILLGNLSNGELLQQFATYNKGVCTGDDAHFRRHLWEIDTRGEKWSRLQGSVEVDTHFGGNDSYLLWENGNGELVRYIRLRLGGSIGAWIRGAEAWGKRGVLIRCMGTNPATFYDGDFFDSNTVAIVPNAENDFLPIWTFMSSIEYKRAVREINKKVNVGDDSFVKVPFDLAYWQQVAGEKYPDGLPEPESDDPTQWLFHGRPESSTAPLQVAVARLLGYRWPAEHSVSGTALAAGGAADGVGDDSAGGSAKPAHEKPAASALPLTSPGGGENAAAPMRLSQRARDLVRRCEELLPLADRDGLVPIPSVRGETPAAERVLELLRASFRHRARPGGSTASALLADGSADGALSSAKAVEPPGQARWRDGVEWSDSLLQTLLTEAGCSPGTTLDEWLRNAFFEQHCKLFQNRPFIWQIWDGRKDGFACLVNYHQLNHKALENLTYAYLKDWINAQSAQAKTGKTGADLRLAAAQALQDKLKLILTGEPPYDIFVRWKPLAEQPIGWHPDLNDGVRMNIRPFIEAGILRKNPNIKWTKDRGKEPQRDKDEYPWFSPNGQFTGDRVNDVHLTNAEKQAARKKKNHE